MGLFASLSTWARGRSGAGGLEGIDFSPESVERVAVGMAARRSASATGMSIGPPLQHLEDFRLVLALGLPPEAVKMTDAMVDAASLSDFGFASRSARENQRVHRLLRVLAQTVDHLLRFPHELLLGKIGQDHEGAEDRRPLAVSSPGSPPPRDAWNRSRLASRHLKRATLPRDSTAAAGSATAAGSRSFFRCTR